MYKTSMWDVEFEQMFKTGRNELMKGLLSKTDYSNSEMNLVDDVLHMKFDVPGFSKDDISVEIRNNRGRHELCIDGSFNDREFSKRYIITDDYDVKNISANVLNGVLNIQIPKKEEVTPDPIIITVK